VAIVGALFVIVSALTNDVVGSLSVVGITLAGLPIYWLIRRFRTVKSGQAA
jgi:basic amino acid/polyamine antiporter, APA family